LHQLTTGALISCLALVTTGCESVRDASLTGRLWTGSPLNVPAPEPNAKFFRRTDNRDVLVTYDELCERKDKIRRRAFFFQANLERLEQHKKPRFVNPNLASEMNLVLLTVVTNAIPAPEPILTRLSPDLRSFTLVRDGKEYGPFDLPVYVDASGWTERVLLTPLAVTGDVVIAAAIIAVAGGVVVLYAYASGCATR
jgi:hypothetical protein